MFAVRLHLQLYCNYTGGMDTEYDLAQLLRARGARVTPARLNVLAVLRAARRGLSHHEVEQALAASGPMDRVTLYRVLNWLVAQGLAQKVADEHRTFRFSAPAAGERPHGAHPHFVCDDCGKVFCLDDAALALPKLPSGFAGTEVEFSVHGHCAACNHGAGGSQ